MNCVLKYFKKNPMKRFYITIIIPAVAGFFFLIVAFAFVASTANPVPFAYEYILVAALFISLTAYAASVLRSRRLLERQEKAFAQLLFEMADAIRGGLHPAKVIVELSKTSTGALQKELRVAADNIRIGKPFDEVMLALAQNINSSLVKRYSSLIGEAAKIGGEITSVLHRAARDMDDMLKIRDERRRQLTMVATIIYIGFGITAVVLYLLALMYPSLGEINLSFLGMTGVSSQSSSGTYAHIGLGLVKERFFHLLIIMGIGSGGLIGLFKEGSAKEGLIHSLIMVGAATIFFYFTIALVH
jgi:flagellar protein FlaJ